MEYHPSMCGEAQCKAAHAALIGAGYRLSKPGGQVIYHLPGLENVISRLEEPIEALS